MYDELMQRINDLIRKYKLMPERIASPPHRTNQKYVFNTISKAVFLGAKYIGQGELKGNILIVNVFHNIRLNHFLPITNLN